MLSECSIKLFKVPRECLVCRVRSATNWEACLISVTPDAAPRAFVSDARAMAFRLLVMD